MRSGMLLLLTAVLGASIGNHATHQPAPPRLSLVAIGPTMILVTAELANTDSAYEIELVRTDPNASEGRSFIIEGFKHEGRCGSTVDPALPTTTYTYRGRAISGRSDVANSEWSEPVTISTPPAPTAPPQRAPFALQVQPRSAFAVELSWRNGSDNVYGFEVQRKVNHEFVRAALVDPHTTHFVHHGRRPGERVTYRVRAFNPLGVTGFTKEVSVVTPSALPAGPRRQPRLGRCTTRQQAERETASRWDGDTDGWRTLERQVRLGRHTIDLLPAWTCGAQNCSYRLFGKYAGCYRELSPADPRMPAIGGVYFDELTRDQEGWPVIRSVSHSSSTTGGVIIYQFVRGRFVPIDQYRYCRACGTEREEVVACTPPFSDERDSWPATGRSTPCQDDLAIDLGAMKSQLW